MGVSNGYVGASVLATASLNGVRDSASLFQATCPCAPPSLLLTFEAKRLVWGPLQVFGEKSHICPCKNRRFFLAEMSENKIS